MPDPAGALLEATWSDVLLDRLGREIAEASRGHCLRLTGLPTAILEDVAQRLISARCQPRSI